MSSPQALNQLGLGDTTALEKGVMRAKSEKRLLQTAIMLGSLVPLCAGLAGVTGGSAILRGCSALPFDSHYRYLSGLLFGIGILYITTIPDIEKNGERFGCLSAIVLMGGLARLYGVFVEGNPGSVMIFALAMELGLVPILWLWQRRAERKSIRA